MKKRILLTASIFTISCTLFGCSAGGKRAIDIAGPVSKSSVKALAQDENHDECSLLVGMIYNTQNADKSYVKDFKSASQIQENKESSLRHRKEDVLEKDRARVFPLMDDIEWHPYSRRAIEGIKSYCGSDFEHERQVEMQIHIRLRETFIPDWIGH